MFEFIDVSKIFKKEFLAINKINLKIEQGEFVFLVGKSGAGKSTLVKLLLKEENPTMGTILYKNEDITKIRRRNISTYRRNIGFVFQDYRLLPKMTVYENVAFAMEIIGTSHKTIRREIPTVLSMVGLSDKSKSYPDELSGGEKQRVAIARAVVNRPEIIIADEPTGNLDPETSQEIMKIFTEINRRGTTLIMATHDKDIVNRLHKRVVELKKGAIIRDIKSGGYANEG
ncbi:cell division ATP-binding protein FtsE [Sedimentibacter sp. zth1]|uniref:cell division ATP-binding protein FtsE n=1 Tax=Sedimentibacter sp. zth1 TaxID=2816908 RepID=UPI001A9396EA|nr:cell division ATP-binding protein FtsE [Sedimentibacter sp. zth1]QSX06132.1 cell division ATP-binding protein FtsE [Sedimentibacter sp. zth1]